MKGGGAARREARFGGAFEAVWPQSEGTDSSDATAVARRSKRLCGRADAYGFSPRRWASMTSLRANPWQAAEVFPGLKPC